MDINRDFQRKEPKVIRQNSIHIIPFSFQKDFDLVDDLLSGDIWEPNNEEINILSYNHINSLINGENRIFKCFRLTQKGRDEFNLNRNYNSQIKLHFGSNPVYNLYIGKIELYLFETGIGFKVFNSQYDTDDINDIVYINSRANSLMQSESPYKDPDRVYLAAKYNLSKDNVVAREVFLSHIAIRLTEILDIDMFLESHNNFPNRVISFTKVVLQRDIDQHDASRYLFLLKNRLRQGRFFPNDRAKESIPDDCIQLEENNYWAISDMGLVNLVSNNALEDLERMSRYLEHVDCFFIYLFALHQKYSILQLSIKANDEYNYSGEEDNSSASELKERIAFFLAKYSFKHISRMSILDRLYNEIRESLYIEDLLSELAGRIDILNSIIDVSRDRREKEINSQREAFDNKIFILSTIFVIISTAASVWSIIQNLYKQEPPRGTGYFYVLIGSLVAICGSGLLTLLLNRKKKKR